MSISVQKSEIGLELKSGIPWVSQMCVSLAKITVLRISGDQTINIIHQQFFNFTKDDC